MLALVMLALAVVLLFKRDQESIQEKQAHKNKRVCGRPGLTKFTACGSHTPSKGKYREL